MFDLGSAEKCVCIRRGYPSLSCDGDLILQEKGKKVTLKPKQNETAKLLVLDGCYITDNNPKCDAVFFLSTKSQAFLILSELKGADIDHAFEQIKYTQQKQPKYSDLKKVFSESTKKAVTEHAFIISNYQVSKVDLQKLEKNHGLRVKAILHSEAITKMPDLREYL